MKKKAQLYNNSLTKPELSIITAYITTVFVYCIFKRFFFTNTIVDNVISDNLKWLPGSPDLMDVIYILGIPVVVFLIYKLKKSLLRLDTLLLSGFVLILVCTALLSPLVDTLHNLRYTFLIIEPLVIMYYISMIMSEEDLRFLLRFLLKVCIYIWGVFCLVSLIFFITKYQDVYHFGNVGSTNPIGYVSGRLFGGFNDPNHASVISLILLAGIVYLIREKIIKTSEKVILIACAICFILYILLASSRTAFLAIIALVVFINLYITIKKDYGQTVIKRIGRFLLRTFLSLLVIIIAYYLSGVLCRCIDESNSISRTYEWVTESSSSTDISSGRFDIWSVHLKAWSDSPLFGFSSDGIMDYIENYYQDSYIRISATTSHNTYILLLTQGGMIGFVLMSIFMFLPFIRALKPIIKRKECPNHVLLFTIICIIIYASSLTYSYCFTILRFEGDIFWLALGGLNTYSYRLKNESKLSTTDQ